MGGVWDNTECLTSGDASLLFNVARELLREEDDGGFSILFELVLDIGVPSRTCDFFFPKRKAMMLSPQSG